MGMPSIHTLLSEVQVRWVGHVSCMSDECLPKRLLYGKLLVGKCPVGRSKMWFKDSLKMSLKDLDIPVKTWERLASNQVRWWGQISRGVMAAENCCAVEATCKWAKRNPEPQATCRHTKPVNHRCGHHHWSMDEQQQYLYLLGLTLGSVLFQFTVCKGLAFWL